jgi:hypothetical protein
MYMVWEGPDSAEAAILVFAKSARDARQLGHGNGALGDGCWIETRVRWLRDEEHGYLRAAATEDGPHVVDNPPSCSCCLMWGVGPIDGNGYCAGCRGEEAT